MGQITCDVPVGMASTAMTHTWCRLPHWPRNLMALTSLCAQLWHGFSRPVLSTPISTPSPHASQVVTVIPMTNQQ